MRTNYLFLQSFKLLFVLGFFQSLQAEEYQLVWSDEFNKSGQPDPKKWGYEQGFIRNKEAQYYTKNRKKNARVENGHLIIEAHKEIYPNLSFQKNSKNWRKARKQANYTSAALITMNKASWQYGKIEIRAKLPKGKGTWPAIWMMGTDRTKVGWPQCGEIDIMEQLGRKPQLIHGTIHWNAGTKTEKKHKSKGGNIKTAAPSEHFHIYSVEWTKNKISFALDHKTYHKIDLTTLPENQAEQFRKPYYLLINLALGGTWGKKIDDSIFPQQYRIDYVRVYQKRIEN